MSRYFTRPRAAVWIEDEHYSPDPGPLNGLTVDDHTAIDTGLLDSRGDAIWRGPNPMGFGKNEEWA